MTFRANLLRQGETFLWIAACLRLSTADRGRQRKKGRSAKHKLGHEPPPVVPLNNMMWRNKTAILHALAMIWINWSHWITMGAHFRLPPPQCSR